MSCKIMDVLLRDGGYCNNWEWPIDLAKKIVTGLNDAGVDYVEIGYRRPKGSGFTYCGDDFVKKHFPGVDNLVVMIDAKDYFIENTKVIDVPLLKRHFKKDSPICMVRVAVNPDEILAGRLATQHLSDMGYKTTINIMKMTTLTLEECECLDNIYPSLKHLEYLYFADSYGSLAEIASCMDKYDSIPGGFHSHNNKGMSLALSINFGGIVDGSIGGVGRGAGNLDTVQFLLEKTGKFNYELYKLLKQITKIKKMAQCGYSYEYHYAGIHQIHPMYVYNLKEMHKFGSHGIIEILSKITPEKANSCDMEYLRGLL